MFIHFGRMNEEDFSPLVYDFLENYITYTLSLRLDLGWLMLHVGQWWRITPLKTPSLHWLDIQLSSFPAQDTFEDTL